MRQNSLGNAKGKKPTKTLSGETTMNNSRPATASNNQITFISKGTPKNNGQKAMNELR
jgi:hypothetical protein